jgi:hypothetical protein
MRVWFGGEGFELRALNFAADARTHGFIVRSDHMIPGRRGCDLIDCGESQAVPPETIRALMTNTARE